MGCNWFTLVSRDRVEDRRCTFCMDWPDQRGELSSGAIEYLLARLLVTARKDIEKYPDAVCRKHQELCNIIKEKSIEPNKIEWIETAVPLGTISSASENKGALAWFLLGLLPQRADGHILCRTCDEIGNESWEALELALNLAGTAKDSPRRFFIALPRHSKTSFSGDSLGLPVWLGAKTLLLLEEEYKNSREALLSRFENILATGALNKSGDLMKVSRITQKKELATSACASHFLYPASCEDEGGFPIRSTANALYLLKNGVSSYLWGKIKSCSKIDFWYDLLSLSRLPEKESALVLDYAETCGCFSPLQEKEDHILNGLKQPALNSIIGNICEFADISSRSGQSYTERLFRPFSLQWAQNQEKTLELYLLAQHKFTLCNRNGTDPTGWTTLIDKCRKSVEATGRAVESAYLSERARIGESYHNRFHFTLPEPLMARINEKLTLFESYREYAAGEAYGMLCHSAAFSGEYDNALKFADKSEYNFGFNEADKLRRDADRAYIYWDKALDAASEKDREECLNKGAQYAQWYISRSTDLSIKQNNRYVELLKARKLAEKQKASADTLEEKLEALSKEAENALLTTSPSMEHPHPLQLYFYNVGLAILSAPSITSEQIELARKCLWRSLAICINNPSSLILNSMGLLPLSLLIDINEKQIVANKKTITDEQRDTEEHHKAAEEQRKALGTAKNIFRMLADDAVEARYLNPEHFKDLLETVYPKLYEETLLLEERFAGGGDDCIKLALAKVKANPKTWFPFNYR